MWAWAEGPCHMPAHSGSIKNGSKILSHLAHHKLGLSPHLDSVLCDWQIGHNRSNAGLAEKRAGNTQLGDTILISYQCFTFTALHAPAKESGRWGETNTLTLDTHLGLARPRRLVTAWGCQWNPQLPLIGNHCPSRNHPAVAPYPSPPSASPASSDPCSYLVLSKMLLSTIFTH